MPKSATCHGDTKTDAECTLFCSLGETMQFVTLFLLIAVVFADAKMLKREQIMMGTFASISLESKDLEHFSALFGLLQSVEASLSSYKESTPISNLNRYGFAKLDNYSREALLLSRDFYEESGGYFDITLGSVTHGMYAFGKGDFLPHPTLKREARLGVHAIKIGAEYATILPKMQVDLGGMGKGYGVDKAVDLLKNKGVQHAIVALSGDIRCLGGCEIAIQNPWQQQGSLFSFTITAQEMGVSTSGTYNRFVKNETNNHLIDPKSRKSGRLFDSLTLIGKLSSARLDAYATACSVMPKERAYAFLDALDLAYIAVEHETKRRVVSKNIGEFVEKFKELLLDEDAS